MAADVSLKPWEMNKASRAVADLFKEVEGALVKIPQVHAPSSLPGAAHSFCGP
jgi:hypothetical protein